MNLISSLFSTITTAMLSVHADIATRSDARLTRLEALSSPQMAPLVKQAFDTRRINSDTDFNPRRNLQNYQRSEPFITKEAAEQIKIFHKLKEIVDDIKADFIGDPDWLDSKVRILSSALDRTLRSQQNDMDFSQTNMDYLSELLYLRYRLIDANIQKMDDKLIKEAILAKDEKLFLKQCLGQVNKHAKIIKNKDMQQSALGSDAITSSDGKKIINLTINM